MSLPRLAALALLLLGPTGCFAPTTPGQRIMDSARELNLAARFGRLDLAASHAAPGARSAFLERRAQWGNAVRVLDVNLANLALADDNKAAEVTIDVAWNRIEESTLRTTRIAQAWRDQDTGWQLVREKRVGGDLGLFGEPVEVVRRPTVDTHFASKTIR